MQNLWQILQALNKKFPSFHSRIQEAQALARWELAVGPLIAKHTRVVRVEEKVLYIETDHPAWQAELQARKRQILDKLNNRKEAHGGDGSSLDNGANAPLTDASSKKSQPPKNGEDETSGSKSRFKIKPKPGARSAPPLAPPQAASSNAGPKLHPSVKSRFSPKNDQKQATEAFEIIEDLKFYLTRSPLKTKSPI
jgi:hypothetical protein